MSQSQYDYLGGYIGSPQQVQSETLRARLEGQNHGFHQGQDAGYELGYQQGYVDGEAATVEIANHNMREQLAYTKQHLEEKQRLQKVVDKQNQRIVELEALVKKLHADNLSLQKGSAQSTALVDTINELRTSNDQLTKQKAELTTALNQKAAQMKEDARTHNKSVLFIKAIREALEELSAESKGQFEKQLAKSFTKHYRIQLDASIKKGLLNNSLENDIVFADIYPKTHEFIVRLLNSAEGPESQPQSEAESFHPDW